MKTNLLVVLFLLPTSLVFCQFGVIYPSHEIDKWQQRYRKSNQEMLDKALLPFLSYAEKRKLGTVQLYVPKTDNSDPLGFFVIDNTITMSAQSMMFLWDICLSFTWLNENRKDLAAVTDYAAMLRYQKPGNFPGGKYPTPLKALGISRSVENDQNILSKTLRLFNNARAAILAHELGHIYYNHPGNRAPGVTPAMSRANETQADLFALDVLSRDAAIPVGWLLFQQVTSHYNWDSKNSTHPNSAQRIYKMAEYLEQNIAAFTRTGNPRSLVISVAGQFRALAQKLEDPDIQHGTQIAAENAGSKSFRVKEYSQNTRTTSAFIGNYSGSYIRYLPNRQSESLNTTVILNRNGDRVYGSFNFGLGSGQITEGQIINGKLYFNWSFGRYYGEGVLSDTGNGNLKGTWGYAGYPDPENNGGEWKLGRN